MYQNTIIPVSQQIENFFDLLASSASSEKRTTEPRYRLIALDVIESPSGFEIKADLPGFKKENIKLEFKEKSLNIEVENLKTTIDEDNRWVFNERFYGRSQRKLRFGEDVDETSINAKYEDGVLTIKVAKKPVVAPSIISIG